MKKLFPAGLILLILIVFSAISLTLLCHTEKGTACLLRLSKHFLPGELTYKAVHGHLLGNLVIEDLHYHTDSMDLQINQLAISSQLLYFTRLVSDKIIVDHIKINITHSPKQKKSSHASKGLPFTFQAKSIELRDLNIAYQNKQLIAYDQLSGQALLTKKKSYVVIINETLGATKLLEYKQNHHQYLLNAAIPFKFINLVLHCKGDEQQTQIEGLITDRQKGLLTVRGSLDFSSNLKWQFYSKAINIHPHLFMPNWVKSEVNFSLRSTGTMENNQVFLENAFGKIKDQPFQGNASVWVENDLLKDVSVNIEFKNNTFFKINGHTFPTWHFAWATNIPSLSAFMQDSKGTIQAHGDITGSTNNPIINGVVDVKNLQWKDLVVPPQIIQFTWNPINKKKLLSLQSQVKSGTFSYLINHDPIKIKLQHGYINSELNQDYLSNHLDLNTEHGKIIGTLQLVRKFSDAPLTKQPIKGTFECQQMEPKLLEFFVSYIKKMQGELQAHLLIAGTLEKPIFKGDMALKKGSFVIPKQNLVVQDVNILASGDQNKIDYQGSLASGKGKLSIKGITHLDRQEVLTDLNLQGENVLIANTNEIKINASPKINLQLTKNELRMQGKIFIPDANLQPRNFDGNESMSDDIIYVQKEGKPTSSSGLQIKSNIDLELGDHILLNFQGIKGKVLGNLKIVDSPERATIGFGQLRIQNGTYSVYNRVLQIDYGKLNFLGGPISNPSLDIRASRTIQTMSNSLLDSEQLRVGVGVMGTLKKPKINLFSEPAGKSPEDILSYLLLGIPVSTAKNGGMNTQLLLQAADAINLGGSSSIGNLKTSLQKSLGLSELDLGTQSQVDPKTQETIQHTSFVLGKFLSPKFYINYSLDLFDHTNTLKVRYFMNKYWTLQSITNTKGSGVDILYTVER